MTPTYCTQNDGDCRTCSLVSYGRDCMNNPVQDIRRGCRVTADVSPAEYSRLQEIAALQGVPMGTIAAEMALAGLRVVQERPTCRILRPREWGPGVPPQERPW